MKKCGVVALGGRQKQDNLFRLQYAGVRCSSDGTGECERRCDPALVPRQSVNHICRGTAPSGVAFDGANIWVTDPSGDEVIQLRARDGKVLRTVFVPDDPDGVAFDGANIWATSDQTDLVTEVRVRDARSAEPSAWEERPLWGLHLMGSTSGCLTSTAPM
jgi:hypothetical protein